MTVEQIGLEQEWRSDRFFNPWNSWYGRTNRPLGRSDFFDGRLMDRKYGSLSEKDVRLIQRLVIEREEMRSVVIGLSNLALAKKFDCHRRLIERIVSDMEGEYFDGEEIH